MKPNGLIEFTAPATVRRKVYERDSFTCRDCGLVGKPGKSSGCIQAWHLISLRQGGEHTIDNLITICVECRNRRERQRKRLSRLSAKSATRSGKLGTIVNAAEVDQN
jgi:5-methylcytosine-specific restriction endonuclease McrA